MNLALSSEHQNEILDAAKSRLRELSSLVEHCKHPAVNEFLQEKRKLLAEALTAIQEKN